MVWEAFRLSQKMGIRPSELYGVARYPNDVLEFWFDRAVIRFGEMVEADIQEVTDKAKNARAAKASSQQALLKWLDHDGAMTGERFAKPAVTKRR